MRPYGTSGTKQLVNVKARRGARLSAQGDRMVGPYAVGTKQLVNVNA